MGTKDKSLHLHGITFDAGLLNQVSTMSVGAAHGPGYGCTAVVCIVSMVRAAPRDGHHGNQSQDFLLVADKLMDEGVSIEICNN